MFDDIEDEDFAVVGHVGVRGKKILLRGFELIDLNDKRIALGPVLVYAVDMSSGYIAGVLGLNVIREFETKIKFGAQTKLS